MQQLPHQYGGELHDLHDEPHGGQRQPLRLLSQRLLYQQGTKGAQGTASFPGHVATNGTRLHHLSHQRSTAFTSWAGGKFTHAATDTNCSSCHNGTTATGMTTPPHIRRPAIQCSNCHTNTAASFTTYTMSHTAVTSSRVRLLPQRFLHQPGHAGRAGQSGSDHPDDDGGLRLLPHEHDKLRSAAASPTGCSTTASGSRGATPATAAPAPQTKSAPHDHSGHRRRRLPRSQPRPRTAAAPTTTTTGVNAAAAAPQPSRDRHNHDAARPPATATARRAAAAAPAAATQCAATTDAPARRLSAARRGQPASSTTATSASCRNRRRRDACRRTNPPRHRRPAQDRHAAHQCRATCQQRCRRAWQAPAASSPARPRDCRRARSTQAITDRLHARCHNGVAAPGKSPKHVVTSAPCESCHKSTATFAGARMNHTGITANCASCHNGVAAPGKSPSTSSPTRPARPATRAPSRSPAPHESHGHHRELRELPQRRRRARQAAKPHRHQRAVRELPQEHRDVRRRPDESRRNHRELHELS